MTDKRDKIREMTDKPDCVGLSFQLATVSSSELANSKDSLGDLLGEPSERSLIK